MRKFGVYCLLLFLFAMLHLSNNGVCQQKNIKYKYQSGLMSKQVVNLSNLCQIWGFLKYYHPAVYTGKYDWDDELFKMIPIAINTQSERDLNTVLEKWVYGLGSVKECKECSNIPNDSIKLRPDYGNLFDKNNLSRTLRKKLDFIRANYSPPDSQFYYVERPKNFVPQWINFRHELGYEQDEISTNKNLLSLFRFWNVIQYFYPYRHLMDDPWDKVLIKFIPIFLTIKNMDDYILACNQLLTSIDDSHANQVVSNGDMSYDNKGLPIKVRFIENKLIVSGYYIDSSKLSEKLQVGDVIEAIDGTPITDLVNNILSYTPASNYDTKLLKLENPMNSRLLVYNKDSLSLLIKRGGLKRKIVLRLMPIGYNSILYNAIVSKAFAYRIQPFFSMLSGDIGYINASSMVPIKDTISVLNSLTKSKGLVVDLRHYPGDNFPIILSTILQKGKSPFIQFYDPTLRLPGSVIYSRMDSIDNTDQYQNKIVVLVNAGTQSYGEYSTMMLQSRKNVTVLGSRTAGADGQTTTLLLSYGIDVKFTGQGVQYPDGTESQRKGVKIDVLVHPTTKGIKEGRDELLDKAIKILNTKNN